MTKRTAHHSRQKRTALVLLIAILAFVLVLVGTLAIFINVTLGKIARPDPDQTYLSKDEAAEYDLRQAIEDAQQPDVVYPELDESEFQWTSPKETIGSKQDLVNILLIGQDRREGESRQRSDTMILVTFDKNRGKITMTSFLRDMYVQIPGYDGNRLNAAYAFGGMKLLDETLEANFGVQVDANMEVDFSGFSEIIDILGGVDIALTQAEAEYMGRSAGLQHLDGEAALTYSRIRYIDSDFGRTERQRNVLSSVYESVKNLSITQAFDLIDAVFPLLTTDMTNTEIISYAVDLFPMLARSDLVNCRIPADGTYSYNTVRGMAIIAPDFEANREILKETLSPEG